MAAAAAATAATVTSGMNKPKKRSILKRSHSLKIEVDDRIGFNGGLGYS